MWTLVFKLNGSVNSPALIIRPETNTEEACENFFGSTGSHGGSNDYRARFVDSYPTKEEALKKIQQYSDRKYNQPITTL